LLAVIRASPELRVAGVISDSAFSDFESVVYERAKKRGYPTGMAWLVFQQMKWQQEGFDLEAVDAASRIGELKIPQLILHCANDTVVPVSHFRRFKELGNGMMTTNEFMCNNPRRNNHVQGYLLDDYDQIVLSWIADTLQAAKAAGGQRN
jgi:hypothetical protein